jgi:hypothetical protein
MEHAIAASVPPNAAACRRARVYEREQCPSHRSESANQKEESQAQPRAALQTRLQCLHLPQLSLAPDGAPAQKRDRDVSCRSRTKSTS